MWETRISDQQCRAEQQANAVKTQVWIAVCVDVLVAIVRKEADTDRSLADILQILSLTLLEKEPLSRDSFNQRRHDLSTQDRNPVPLFELWPDSRESPSAIRNSISPLILRSALPRWLILCFSSDGSSATVRPNSST